MIFLFQLSLSLSLYSTLLQLLNLSIESLAVVVDMMWELLPSAWTVAEVFLDQMTKEEALLRSDHMSNVSKQGQVDYLHPLPVYS